MKCISILLFLFFFLSTDQPRTVKNWAVKDWPGGEGSRIDITQPDMGSNLSGAVWNRVTKKLWVVSNSGYFWRMSQTDPKISDSWVVDSNGGSVAKWHVTGDTEAITQADWDRETVFVGVERPARLIREYDVSGPLGTVNLINSWDVSAQMGSGDNAGLEALTFVPDKWLKKKSFVDGDGALYTSSKYGTGGLFFAGLQANAHIFVFDLDCNMHGNYSFVGEYTTGQMEIAGLEFDRSDGTLYAYHNYGNTSGGDNDLLQALDLTPVGSTFVADQTWHGPRKHNNEGIAIVGYHEFNLLGFRNFFLTTDDAGSADSLGIYPHFPAARALQRADFFEVR